MIDMGAVAHMAIAYQQPRHFQSQVVTSGLIQNLLADFDIRGFAFHQQEGFSAAIVYEDVVAFQQRAHFDLFFYTDEAAGHPELLNKVVDEHLANPLFGIGFHLFLTHRIPKGGAGPQTGSYLVKVEVNGLHIANLQAEQIERREAGVERFALLCNRFRPLLVNFEAWIRRKKL